MLSKWDCARLLLIMSLEEGNIPIFGHNQTCGTRFTENEGESQIEVRTAKINMETGTVYI